MEMSVDEAKKMLSLLLRKEEKGEDVVIRDKGTCSTFRIVQVPMRGKRNLKPDPRWKGKIKYRDEDIWESEVLVRER